MSLIKSAAAQGASISVAADPKWAAGQDFQRPEDLAAGLIDRGLIFWLVDDQINLMEAEPWWRHRIIKEVGASDGLEQAAAIDIDFDPHHERLIVHHVRVLRNERVRDLARVESFEVLRRERDLERAVYDGRLTAHMVIPDLRVGDVVDLCYSLAGANPVHQGRFGASARFQWSVPVQLCRYRILAPVDRRIVHVQRGMAPAYSETGFGDGGLDRCWLARDFPAHDYEADTPAWLTGESRLSVADEMSWADVADIYRQGYADDGGLPEELDSLVAEIAAANPGLADRTAAALKFVQREIRYLAVGIGDGGLVPRSVGDIWAARAGDCKGASRLLSALLRRLGVDACPALVHSAIGWNLDREPPTVVGFDHCIVRVCLDGATYWLDPTRGEQGGRLDILSQARFGWALPLVESATLEAMGEDSVVDVHEQECRFVIGETLKSPAELVIRSVARSWRADNLRRRLANEGVVALAKRYREFYENSFGRLEVVEPLQVDDREADNEIHIVEAYRLLDVWKVNEAGDRAEFATLDEVIHEQLTTSSTLNRRTAIDLGAPRRVSQRVVVMLPFPWRIDAYDERAQVGGTEIHTSAALFDEHRRLEIDLSVRVENRVLEPALAREYFDACERARRSSGMTLSHTVRDGEFQHAEAATPSTTSGFGAGRWIWFGLMALIALSQCVRTLTPPS